MALIAASSSLPSQPPRDPLEPNKVFVPWTEPDYDLLLRVQKKVLIEHNHHILTQRKLTGMVDDGDRPANEDAGEGVGSFPGDAVVCSGTATVGSTGPTKGGFLPTRFDANGVPTAFMCNVLIEDALRQALTMIRTYRESSCGGAISEQAKELIEELRVEVKKA